MKYLITGHTGFKGAWLSLMLHEAGHEVVGLSLDPEPGSLFELARVSEVVTDHRQDIRDPSRTAEIIREENPDVIVHMAAQALVRESYRRPHATYETNVMGTYNVLQAAEEVPNLKAMLVITTDKVYRNIGKPGGYVEDDALGGIDPYSASKAAADVVTQSWIAIHPEIPTAIARSGNVVGGGDVCADRLMVDLLRSYAAGEPVQLRYPGAVRPWQHVLDSLNGYRMIIDSLLDGHSAGEAFNIGPDPRNIATVQDVAEATGRLWGGAQWTTDGRQHPHEANLLTLDASKARNTLGWSDRLDLEKTLAWTVEWARKVRAGNDARETTLKQIAHFSALAQSTD